MGKSYIGVDLGGTKTAVLLSETPPVVVERVEFSTLPERGPQPALERIVDSIGDLLKQHDRRIADITAIGVSCGSPLDRVRGIIQAPPNMPTWVDVPIRRILEDRFHSPCRLENDANAGAVAEHRFGAGQGVKHMVFLTLGTGLGAGIIIDGKIYHGAEDSAGEIGHVRLTRNGPVGYNKAGSVEGWSSGGGIARLGARMAAQAERRGESSILSRQIKAGQTPTARDIAEAARAGDHLASRVLATSGTRLGQTIAILIDVLNPQRIVLGGLAARIGDDLLSPCAKRSSARRCRRPPKIVRSCRRCWENESAMWQLCAWLSGCWSKEKRAPQLSRDSPHQA